MINTSFTRVLTQREIEVLMCVAQGQSAKNIAQELGINHRTVEAHIHMMKVKTSSRNRAHLVAMALEEGLIENPCSI